MSKTWDLAVVGGGKWGQALVFAAARGGANILWFTRRAQPGLPSSVEVVSDLSRLKEAPVVLLAVPSVQVRELGLQLGGHLNGSHVLVHGIRGLVGENLQTVSQVLREVTPVRRIGALAGPAIAEEMMAASPTVLMVGSRYNQVVRQVQGLFSSPDLRAFGSDDLLGVEWASAVIATYALSVGYARAVQKAVGMVAAIMTGALLESARLAEAAGGRGDTLNGLAGTGDLLACLGQPSRPEIVFGQALASGMSVEEAREKVGQRIEAFELVDRLLPWAQARGINVPVLEGLHRILWQGQGVEETVGAWLNPSSR